MYLHGQTFQSTCAFCKSLLTMKKSVLFIVNPISGTRMVDNFEKIVYDTLDNDKFDIFFRYTKYKNHGSEIAAEAVKQGVNIIAAVGGDGTVNEVASQIVNTSSVLAVIPKGSGNGLAYHMQIPVHIKKALKIINEQNFTTIDTCKINGHYFFSIAGIGFDAKVAFDFNNEGQRGFQNYLKHILINYFEYQSAQYLIKYDGQELETDAFFITFANSSQWGYNVKIAPRASICDGKLDVCICQRPNFLKFVNVDLPHLLTNHFNRSSLVHYLQCEKATIIPSNGQKTYLHIDGDAAGKVDGIELEMFPRSLLICVKNDYLLT